MATADMALLFFLVLFLFRYVRTVVSIFTFVRYKPKPVAENPRYGANDVTVVIPTTFKTPDELITCLRLILSNSPRHVFVVTSQANVTLVKTFCGMRSPLKKFPNQAPPLSKVRSGGGSSGRGLFTTRLTS